MSAPRYDLLGLGNAIVDVLAHVEAGFLDAHGMVPGSMRLVDEATATALHAALPPGGIETGGGSAANTCVVAARLGLRTAFLGKVADDGLGAAYRRDMRESGIAFPSPPAAGGMPTGRCVIAVTPDGQRTMSTFLGAANGLTPADVDAGLVADAAWIYLEGYLFDPPAAQEAFRAAAAAAHAAGRRVALSLSDRFCVERHRSAFRALLRHVDLLFANESEACALFETEEFDAAARAVGSEVRLAALTRSEAGSVVLSEGGRVDVAATPVALVDSTGAGDAYAAGFLAGLARDLPLDRCAALGGRAAAAIIARLGARPGPDFAERLAA